MRINNSAWILLLLLLGFFSSGAQALKNCGNYKIDTAAIRSAREFEARHYALPNNQQRLAATSVVVRVYFHIVTCDNGSVPAATEANLATEFNTLVAAYTANNICFLNAGFDYINSTYLDSNFNANTDNPNVFDPFRVPNCINIFYVFKIKGNNNACNNCGIGGTSLTIPNTFCLVSTGNIGQGQTIAHEVGHCMGLLHTFETANGTENINGSNASSTGDQITDTPADPYAYSSQNCFAITGCAYTGNCTDPNGSSLFTPPYTNLMAYWWSSVCYPSLSLTGGQYTRVNSFLSTNTPLQNCQSPANALIGPAVSVSSGYYMQSAVNSLSTTGGVTLSGSVVSALGGQTIRLEPGFHANPAGGFVVIRPIPCN